MKKFLEPAAQLRMATILYVVGFLLVYGLLRLLELRICIHVAGEPPIVGTRVPIVGHIVGLMRNGVSYYRTLRFVRVARCYA